MACNDRIAQADDEGTPANNVQTGCFADLHALPLVNTKSPAVHRQHSKASPLVT